MSPRYSKQPSLSDKTSSSNQGGTGNAILPRVRTIADNKLQALLGNLFDQIDDALFGMAERANVNADQNLYFEAMRDCRMARAGVLTRFKGEFGSAFDLMVAGETTNTWNKSRLSIVRDSELEENVAIESMIAKVRGEFGDELALFSLRLDRLITVQLVDEGNNVLSPEKVSTAFLEAFTDIDVDVRIRLLILKLFEKSVLAKLGNLYNKLNTFLADAGVLPNVQLAEKEIDKLQDHDDGTGVDETFSNLQQQLRNNRDESVSHQDQNVTVLRRSMVVDTLSAITPSAQSLPTDDAGYVSAMPEQIDLKQTLLDMVNEGVADDSRVELGTADADAIDLVSMLFATLGEDEHLALPLRALLNLLQVPIAKVALMDKSLFGEEVHPARKLLDEMADAAMGWRPGMNAERDFLYRKIKEIIELVLIEFSDDMHLFQQALADFTIFRDAETKRHSLAAQRLVDRGMGQARAEAANEIIKTEITNRIDGITMPTRVREVIKQHWSKLLFLIYLREGEQGENWLSGLKVIDELVWSIAPKITPPDKSRLARLLPSLKRSLYSGLSRMEVSNFEMNRLFDELEECHQLAANGKAKWGIPTQTGSTTTSSRDDIEDIKILSDITEGGWYDLNDEEGVLYRLSAIIDPPGHYIFIDRNGRDVQTYTRAELADKIVKDAVDKIDDRQFFERAIEAIQNSLQ